MSKIKQLMLLLKVKVKLSKILVLTIKLCMRSHKQWQKVKM